MRALAVIVVVALCGCNFAVKHPSVTAGIVAGSLGLMTCSLTTPIDGDPNTPAIDDVGKSSRIKCYGVTAGIGLGLALLTRLALWLGTEDETAPGANPDGDTISDPGNLEPAPVFVPKRTPKPPPEPKPEPTPEPTPEQPPPPQPEPPQNP